MSLSSSSAELNMNFPNYQTSSTTDYNDADTLPPEQAQQTLESSTVVSMFDEPLYNAEVFGSLRKGDVVHFFSTECLGLVAATFASSFALECLGNVLFPMLREHYEFQIAKLQALQRITLLPATLCFLFGLLSDSYPIMGVRRKGYLLIGLATMAMSLFILAALDAYASTLHSSSHTGLAVCMITLVTCASVGNMFTFMSVHTRVIELAQREPLGMRGTIVATYSIFRFAISIFTNGCIYLLQQSTRYLYLALVSFGLIIALTIPLVWRAWHEKYYSLSTSMKIRGQIVWKVMQQRAVWNILAFTCIFTFFSCIMFINPVIIVGMWAGAAQDNVYLKQIINYLVMMLTAVVWRRYFMNRPWRPFFGSAILFVIVPQAIVTTCVTLDVLRDPFFYRIMNLFSSVSSGIKWLADMVTMTEIVQEGSEGAMVGLILSLRFLVTIFVDSNATGLFRGTNFYNMADVALDTPTARVDVLKALCLNYGINALALLGLVFLPRQKLDTQQLRCYGGYTKCASAAVVTFGVVFFIYSLTITVLTLNPSTSCLGIAGGDGLEEPKVRRSVHPPKTPKRATCARREASVHAHVLGIPLLRREEPQAHGRERIECIVEQEREDEVPSRARRRGLRPPRLAPVVLLLASVVRASKHALRRLCLDKQVETLLEREREPNDRAFRACGHNFRHGHERKQELQALGHVRERVEDAVHVSIAHDVERDEERADEARYDLTRGRNGKNERPESIEKDGAPDEQEADPHDVVARVHEHGRIGRRTGPVPHDARRVAKLERQKERKAREAREHVPHGLLLHEFPEHVALSRERRRDARVASIFVPIHEHERHGRERDDAHERHARRHGQRRRCVRAQCKKRQHGRDERDDATKDQVRDLQRPAIAQRLALRVFNHARLDAQGRDHGAKTRDRDKAQGDDDEGVMPWQRARVERTDARERKHSDGIEDRAQDHVPLSTHASNRVAVGKETDDDAQGQGHLDQSLERTHLHGAPAELRVQRLHEHEQRLGRKHGRKRRGHETGALARKEVDDAAGAQTTVQVRIGKSRAVVPLSTVSFSLTLLVHLAPLWTTRFNVCNSRIESFAVWRPRPDASSSSIHHMASVSYVAITFVRAAWDHNVHGEKMLT
ncbi:hypothetical protein PsorP6_009774 [Peronosclerospora sorghi]|uniref:Uncharacterized protein n=1 Tax=Peronosclerospora sorghi TaxID=230839 RepID=A0ACC0W0N9_9STRA|nr:hypothetical protein PsorP6_009774 [Peronosclerospora sorghi]